MKKYTKIIIITFLFLSSHFTIFAANSGYIGNLFSIETGPEVMKLNSNINSIKNFNFKSAQLHNKLTKYKNADKLLKNEFIRLYESDQLSYYAMSSITKNYNLFVYHINRMFYYESIKEITPHYKELDTIILNHYKKARNYYNKVQYTVKTEQERNSRRNLFRIYD